MVRGMIDAERERERGIALGLKMSDRIALEPRLVFNRDQLDPSSADATPPWQVSLSRARSLSLARARPLSLARARSLSPFTHAHSLTLSPLTLSFTI